MAELRRRATERLRRLEHLLSIVQAEYQAAAAECERLKAAKPGVNEVLDGNREGELAIGRLPVSRRSKPVTAASRRRDEGLERLMSHLSSASARDTGREDVAQTDTRSEPARDRSATRALAGAPPREAGSLLSFLDDLVEALSPASDRPPRP
jgi:hypothetical protein